MFNACLPHEIFNLNLKVDHVLLISKRFSDVGLGLLIDKKYPFGAIKKSGIVTEKIVYNSKISNDSKPFFDS